MTVRFGLPIFAPIAAGKPKPIVPKPPDVILPFDFLYL